MGFFTEPFSYSNLNVDFELSIRRERSIVFTFYPLGHTSPHEHFLLQIQSGQGLGNSVGSRDLPFLFEDVSKTDIVPLTFVYTFVSYLSSCNENSIWVTRLRVRYRLWRRMT